MEEESILAFYSILVEGEIQQNERYDEEVSFSSILAEAEPLTGGFAQIIMLNK